MIASKDDYITFRKRDGTWKKSTIFKTGTFKFKVLLRKAEYYRNCRSSFLGRLLAYIYARRVLYYGRKIGFSIPLNVFGPGLSLPHTGTIVVNPAARVGADCRIHVCVNIGASGGSNSAPQIGDGAYIAPGAKIFGGIRLGDRIAIGANAVVNKSFPDNDITLVGMPAKVAGRGGAIEAGWNPNSRETL